MSNVNPPQSADENISLTADTSQEVSNTSTSTPEHSALVLSGIVPASLTESFIFPDISIKGEKPPSVMTKAHFITSDNMPTMTKLEKSG